MNAKRADICGAIDIVGGTEYKCYKPPHVKLRLVRPGDTARTLQHKQVPHVFESRYPYRNKEQ